MCVSTCGDYSIVCICPITLVCNCIVFFATYVVNKRIYNKDTVRKIIGHLHAFLVQQMIL